MHRRDALGLLGGAVAGLAAGPTLRADHAAADHAMPAGPLGQFHLYVCPYHMAKKDPNFVTEAPPSSPPVREEAPQCVIFKKGGRGPRIRGVEYITPDRLYRTLPDAE